MPGTNNFLQFNPGAANQETDTQYSADALRSGGLANPSIFPSTLGNKVLYQLSTFVAAFAQALATKNYNMSDASLSTLAGVLANVVTSADLSAYAPLASPAFTGTPTAPLPLVSDTSYKVATTNWVRSQGYATVDGATLTNAQATTLTASDNSNRIATTAFVKAQAFQATLGFTPVQQGGGTLQGSNKVYLGWDGTSLRSQVDATDIGRLMLMSHVTSNNALQGWLKLSTGLILQWGYGFGIPGTGLTYSFPITFPNAVFVMLANDQGGSGSSGVQCCSPVPISNSQFNAFTKVIPGGGAGATNFGWLAIGF